MNAVSYNQRNGGHRKTLCPGAPQGPVQDQSLPRIPIQKHSLISQWPEFSHQSLPPAVEAGECSLWVGWQNISEEWGYFHYKRKAE